MTTLPNWQFASIICAIFISAALNLSDATAGPSFNCKTAHSADEKAICANEFLTSIDTLVAKSYLTYDPRFADKEVVGRAFLHDRASCGADIVCIAVVQWGMLAEYEDSSFSPSPAWVTRYMLAGLERRATTLAGEQSPSNNSIPQTSGQCVLTKIKSITTRWGEEITNDNAGDGTSVEYDNGGSLVEYQRSDTFTNMSNVVKAGHPAVMCLVSIPHDCPIGDDRGRVFYSYDLVTATDWLMADSQHSCGGQ